MVNVHSVFSLDWMRTFNDELIKSYDDDWIMLVNPKIRFFVINHEKALVSKSMDGDGECFFIRHKFFSF